MKNFRFLPLIVVLCSVSFAQDQLKSGVWSLGGSIALATTSTDIVMHGPSQEVSVVGSIITTDFYFGPTIEYFVVDNLQFGLGLSYGSSLPSPGKGLTLTGTKHFSVTITPSVRFFIPFSPSDALFASASGGGNWARFELVGYPTTYSKPVWTYSLASGWDHFLVPSAAVEFALVYNAVQHNPVGAASNLGFRLGFKYFIL